MIIGDFHTHTTYCDGASSAEDMLKAAIEKGFKYYGFSSHSYLKYDESWNMSPASQEEYIKEILSLKEKYKDKIDVLLGCEYDLFSDNDLSQFDYVIASCHCIVKDEQYLSVDESETVFRDIVMGHYDGDSYEFVKDYYDIMSTANQKTEATFFGHFDLINKFNKGFKYFSEQDPRYTEPMYNALEKLAKSGKPFELNTAATFRHSETKPTVSANMWLSALNEMGGNIIINSDAHNPDRIGYNFEKAITLAKKCGFKSVLMLTSKGFCEQAI